MSALLNRRVPAPSALATGALAVVGLALLPVVYLVLTAAGLGWTDTVELLTSPYIRDPLIRSIGLAVSVGGSSALLGGTLAWLVTTTDLPGRRVWAIVSALPLVLPSYLLALSYVALYPGARSFVGAWLVLTLAGYPLVFLPVAASLGGLDSSFEETARSLGDSRRRAVARVVVPQIRPALGTGAVLASLAAVSDFAVVTLLEVRTLTVYVYLSYLQGVDPARGALLGCLLGLVALTLVVGESRWRARAVHYRLGPGSARPAATFALGPWRWPAALLPLGVACLGLGVPAVILGRGGIEALRAGMDTAGLWRATQASMVVAPAAAVLAVMAALPVSVLMARRSSRLSRALERSGYLAQSLPAVVVGLAMVFFTVRFAPFVYRRAPMVVLSYLVLFLPLAVSAVTARARQVPPVLANAARSLGRGPVQVMRTVTGPLLAPGLAAGLAMVLLAGLKEIPVTLLVRSQSFDTLATRAFAASEAGALGAAAVPSFVLVVVAAVLLRPLLRGTNARL